MDKISLSQKEKAVFFRLQENKGRWIELILVCSLILSFATVYSGIFPIGMGRDTTAWFRAFADFFSPDASQPVMLLYRGVLTPMFWGIPFQLGIEKLFIILCYFLTGICLYISGRFFGRALGILLVVLYAINFNFWKLIASVGSESLCATGSMILVTILLCSVRHQKIWLWGVSGFVAIMLAYLRPSNQVLLVLAMVPLIVGIDFKVRCKGFLSFVIVFMTFWVLHCSYNYYRFDAFKMGHFGGQLLPLYRIFVQEQAVDTSLDEPATQELIKIVEDKILPLPAFVQAGINKQTFIETPTDRFFGHVMAAYAHEFGWKNAGEKMFRISREQILANPVKHLVDYLDSVVHYTGLPRFFRLKNTPQWNYKQFLPDGVRPPWNTTAPEELRGRSVWPVAWQFDVVEWNIPKSKQKAPRWIGWLEFVYSKFTLGKLFLIGFAGWVLMLVVEKKLSLLSQATIFISVVLFGTVLIRLAASLMFAFAQTMFPVALIFGIVPWVMIGQILILRSKSNAQA